MVGSSIFIDKLSILHYIKGERTGEGSLLSQQWLLTHLAIQLSFRRTGRGFHVGSDSSIVPL